MMVYQVIVALCCGQSLLHCIQQRLKNAQISSIMALLSRKDTEP